MLLRTAQFVLLLTLTSLAQAQDINPWQERLEHLDFKGTQLLAIEAALKERGLEVDRVDGVQTSNLPNVLSDTLLGLGQKFKTRMGLRPEVEGYYHLTVTITRPQRATAIQCEAWVQFLKGSRRLDYLETRNCGTIVSDEANLRIRNAQLFGALPELRTIRDCKVLAPGQSTEGDDKQNCLVTGATAEANVSEAEYNIVVKNSDIFHLER